MSDWENEFWEAQRLMRHPDPVIHFANCSYYYGYIRGRKNEKSEIAPNEYWERPTSCDLYAYALGYEDGEGDRNDG